MVRNQGGREVRIKFWRLYVAARGALHRLVGSVGRASDSYPISVRIGRSWVRAPHEAFIFVVPLLEDHNLFPHIYSRDILFRVWAIWETVTRRESGM